jgi:magnesium transporter
MLRFIKTRSKKVGLPPGTLVHVGERKTEKVRIRLVEYDENQCSEQELDSLDSFVTPKPSDLVTWINIDGLHQTGVLERLGESFNLHPLLLEDVANTDQRPKIEDHTDHLFIVLKMLWYDADKDEITAEQLSLILGAHFVISISERETAIYDLVRDRLWNRSARIRKMKADYLAYALLDAVVDHYFLILEKLGERIESLEDELISSPKPDDLQEIHTLKQELVFLRKSVWPLREVIGTLERAEFSFCSEGLHPFLRDLYDHTIQVVDTVETFRDMVAGMLDIYLSSVSHRLNEVMKVLTMIATIFIPLTFMAGVYGMNFKYMPELEWRWGYPSLWGAMLTVGILMLIYFRRKNWL